MQRSHPILRTIKIEIASTHMRSRYQTFFAVKKQRRTTLQRGGTRSSAETKKLHNHTVYCGSPSKYGGFTFNEVLSSNQLVRWIHAPPKLLNTPNEEGGPTHLPELRRRILWSKGILPGLRFLSVDLTHPEWISPGLY